MQSVQNLIEFSCLIVFLKVKLFWKEVREDMIPPTVERTIWDELPAANVDTTKLEHLFESRAKDLMAKVCVHFKKFFLSRSVMRQKKFIYFILFTRFSWLSLLCLVPLF